ncbi:hypothetical protein V1511DRAFT_460240 [Dipodascopsis uninucleata]
MASSGAAASGYSGTTPGVGDVIGWTQSMAMNGMLSITYPTVYQSFSQNFGWANAFISWPAMQKSIDSFRAKTGGNTTLSSWETLQRTTILDYGSGALILLSSTDTSSSEVSSSKLLRRFVFDGVDLSQSSGNSTSSSSDTILEEVYGLARYAEHLMIPDANVFMTVLLFFAMIIGVIIVAILLFKLTLEVIAQFGTLSKSLESFRQRYWIFLGSTIVRTIVILYGTWVLYCLYQFKRGDSWATLVIAAVILGIITSIISIYSIRIFLLAKRSYLDGNIDELYRHKPWIRVYGLFYGQFKTRFWWFFVPAILVSFGRSAFIALADGHGLVQVIGQIAIETIFVVALLVLRPFNTRAGNIVNSIISVVRVISLVCILVFVEELGISQETTTAVGIALIIVQAVLTCLLAILIIINALISLFSKNPNKRKDVENDGTMKSASESKFSLLAESHEMTDYSMDAKTSRSSLTPSHIGVALTDYEPLAQSNYTEPTTNRRMMPWDDKSTIESSSTSNLELVPLANGTDVHLSGEGSVFSTDLPNLEHSSNGRPMF